MFVCAAVTCGGDRITGVIDASRDRIVFSTQRDGNYELYSMNRDGSGMVRLTATPEDEFQAAPSPDGTRIAFVRADQLFIMNADGSAVTQITGLPESALKHGVQYPSWSPDGRRILVASYEEVVPDLVIIDADGSNAINLTRDPDREIQGAWAPDGRQVAFIRNSGGPLVPHLYVMDSDGGNVRQLTSGDTSDYGASWAPDSRSIVFTRTPLAGPATAVFEIGINGTNLRALTDDQASGTEDRNPSWSRDRSALLFSSTRGGAGGNMDIWVRELDGSRMINLTQTPTINEGDARWLPVP
jgi:TolB protein